MSKESRTIKVTVRIKKTRQEQKPESMVLTEGEKQLLLDLLGKTGKSVWI